MTRATSDVDALGEAFSSGVINIVLDLLMIAGTLAAMLWLDARLTMVLLLLAPPILGVLEFIRRRLRALFSEVREALASVNTFVAERVDGVEVVQLFGNERESERLFDARNDRFRRATTRSNVYDSFMYALVDGAAYTGQDFSGNFDFLETYMLLTVNHEIAPAEEALGFGSKCKDCHTGGQIDWNALYWTADPFEGGERMPIMEVSSFRAPFARTKANRSLK